MNGCVQRLTLAPPPVDYGEILRYAQCPPDADTGTARRYIAELDGALQYSVCYAVFSVRETVDGLDLGFTVTHSADLRRALRGCERCLVFAATLGLELDRRIYRCGRLAPAKALWLQAIGAERIESLCNAFCAQQPGLRPRFSPGYGDLPLALQRDIFSALDCARQIGLTLNDSLLMSPSKSVTAIAGIR